MHLHGRFGDADIVGNLFAQAAARLNDDRVHSTIAVTSGQTVLLGGLISDQDQNSSLEMMRKPRPFAADPVAPIGK
jgi:hypothetical protein